MATYKELFDLRTDPLLRQRVGVACTVAAETIRLENPATANHANRLLWAVAVYNDPSTEALRMHVALLAQDVPFTVAQITTATDAVVLAAVLVLVDMFATGV